MADALGIAALWIGFGGSHVLLSSQALRPRLVSALGESGFAGVYSLVALGFFVPMVWLYFEHKHAGPLLWAVPLGPVLRWVIYAGMGVALVLVVSGATSPSPAAMGQSQSGEFEVRGAHLITRHPLAMGVGLFGILHLVSNGFATDVAFFAGFPLFAVVGGWHQDARKLGAGGERFAEFYAATPFLPFTGRHTLRGLRTLSPVALGVGIGLTIVLRLFHETLFM